MKVAEKITHARAGQPTNVKYPVHLKLPILPAEQQIVIDPRARSKSKFGIVSLLTNHPSGVAQVQHEIFSPVALRLLVPLLKSHYFCPYHYLLAAYQADWDLIEPLLFSPTVEAASRFYDLAEVYRGRLEEVQEGSGDAWEWEMRPIRRAMTEINRSVGAFGLNTFTLRMSGYRLERVVHELHLRKGGPRERNFQWN